MEKKPNAYQFGRDLEAALLARSGNPDDAGVIDNAASIASAHMEVVRKYNSTRESLRDTYEKIIRSAQRTIDQMDKGLRVNPFDDLGSSKEAVTRYHAMLSIQDEQLADVAYDLKSKGIDLNISDYIR